MSNDELKDDAIKSVFHNQEPVNFLAKFTPDQLEAITESARDVPEICGSMSDVDELCMTERQSIVDTLTKISSMVEHDSPIYCLAQQEVCALKADDYSQDEAMLTKLKWLRDTVGVDIELMFARAVKEKDGRKK